MTAPRITLSHRVTLSVEAAPAVQSRCVEVLVPTKSSLVDVPFGQGKPIVNVALTQAELAPCNQWLTRLLSACLSECGLLNFAP